MRRWRGTPVVTQGERHECGLACLAMLSGAHGHALALHDLRTRFGSPTRGTGLPDLLAVGAELDLGLRPLRCELDELRQLRLPAMLHWSLDHFVVVVRVDRRGLLLHDPAAGRRRVAWAEASREFTGVAVEATPTPAFRPRRPASRLRLRDLLVAIERPGGTLARLVGLSLVLQLMALAVPLYGQLLIDRAVLSQDADLAAVLALAFALLTGVHAALQWFRGWFALRIGTQLGFDVQARTFHHLLRLPLGFFQRRHLGDVVSRFESLRPVQGFLTSSAPEVVVDGLLASIVLVVLWIYSPVLTLACLAGLALELATRLGTVEVQRRRNPGVLALAAREQSHFLESVRGMARLKAGGCEARREAAWQHRLAEATHAGFGLALAGTYQDGASRLITGLTSIVVLWLGARAVADGGLTLGMLVAFMAWQAQLQARVQGLAGRALEVRLLAGHLDRLADLTHTEREVPAGQSRVRGRLEGRYTLRGLGFRHSRFDPWVLRGLDAELHAGEFVAIVGPSGCGKSTLLAILASLQAPTEGELLVDGRPLVRPELADYRRQLGVVLQDDALFSGTLLENVASFDPQPDLARVRESAARACVLEDVERMPLGFHSLVGDLGAALSGGQRQRLLLARALYAEPRVLLLDEATSHVDPVTERAIGAALRELQVTRIVVAHRRETVALADRVLDLGGLLAERLNGAAGREADGRSALAHAG